MYHLQISSLIQQNFEFQTKKLSFGWIARCPQKSTAGFWFYTLTNNISAYFYSFVWKPKLFIWDAACGFGVIFLRIQVFFRGLRIRINSQLSWKIENFFSICVFLHCIPSSTESQICQHSIYIKMHRCTKLQDCKK